MRLSSLSLSVSDDAKSSRGAPDLNSDGSARKTFSLAFGGNSVHADGGFTYFGGGGRDVIDAVVPVRPPPTKTYSSSSLSSVVSESVSSRKGLIVPFYTAHTAVQTIPRPHTVVVGGV